VTEDLRALSARIEAFHIVTDDEIFFPQRHDALTFVDGDLYHVCSYGYLRRFGSADIEVFLGLLNTTDDHDILYVLERFPEHTQAILSHACDYDHKVGDDRLITALENLLDSAEDFVFLTAVQALLICVEGGTLDRELPPSRTEAFLRLQKELRCNS